MRRFFEFFARVLFASVVVASSYAEDAGETRTPVGCEGGHELAQGFIWASTPADGNQCYVVFRKSFDLHVAARSAVVHLFADTRYSLWVNGTFIDRGPCRFDPKRPEYDTHDITAALKTGQNGIAVLVHYYAIASFREWNQQCARMMEHAPGLTAKVELNLVDGQRIDLQTDPSWITNAHTRYQPSAGSYSSVPDNIDARLDDGDWTLSDYDSDEPSLVVDGRVVLEVGVARDRRLESPKG